MILQIKCIDNKLRSLKLSAVDGDWTSQKSKIEALAHERNLIITGVECGRKKHTTRRKIKAEAKKIKILDDVADVGLAGSMERETASPTPCLDSFAAQADRPKYGPEGAVGGPQQSPEPTDTHCHAVPAATPVAGDSERQPEGVDAWPGPSDSGCPDDPFHDDWPHW